MNDVRFYPLGHQRCVEFLVVRGAWKGHDFANGRQTVLQPDLAAWGRPSSVVIFKASLSKSKISAGGSSPRGPASQDASA